MCACVYEFSHENKNEICGNSGESEKGPYENIGICPMPAEPVDDRNQWLKLCLQKEGLPETGKISLAGPYAGSLPKMARRCTHAWPIQVPPMWQGSTGRDPPRNRKLHEEYMEQGSEYAQEYLKRYITWKHCPCEFGGAGGGKVF